MSSNMLSIMCTFSFPASSIYSYITFFFKYKNPKNNVAIYSNSKKKVKVL